MKTISEELEKFRNKRSNYYCMDAMVINITEYLIYLSQAEKWPVL